MPDHSPVFISPSVFLVSALCVFATPLTAVIAFASGPRPVRTIEPAVTEVLARNQALAVAADELKKRGVDLSGMEGNIADDNGRWRNYTRGLGPDFLPSPLREELQQDGYWAVYFCPRWDPDMPVLDGDVWIFVRRPDFKILGEW